MEVDIVVQLVYADTGKTMVFEIDSPILCDLNLASGGTPHLEVFDDCRITMRGQPMSMGEFSDMVAGESSASGAIVARVVGRLKLLTNLARGMTSRSTDETLAFIREYGWGGRAYGNTADEIVVIADTLDVMHHGYLEGVPSGI